MIEKTLYRILLICAILILGRCLYAQETAPNVGITDSYITIYHEPAEGPLDVTYQFSNNCLTIAQNIEGQIYELEFEDVEPSWANDNTFVLKTMTDTYYCDFVEIHVNTGALYWRVHGKTSAYLLRRK